MNDEILQALADLQDVLPSEEEMNENLNIIKTVELALKKLPIMNTQQPSYIKTVSENALLGWHLVKRRLYYKDNIVTPRPLMECKYIVRKQMIQFLPILIEKMRTLV